MRHMRVSCSPSNLAALAIGIALANVSMKASNNSVKPDPARAHGVATLRTPHSGHVTRGVRANSVKGQLEKIGVLHPLRLNAIPPERSLTPPKFRLTHSFQRGALGIATWRRLPRRDIDRNW